VALVGLPQSGKTTLLQVLNLLCRRPLLTADITAAAFFDACSRLTPTLLIDETGTHGSGRYLRHLLRMGTSRDVVAMRKNQSFHAYGAKVICFLEPPDDPALTTRCILIPMKETKKTDLLRPTDPWIVERANGLRQQLLQFRLEKYKDLKIPTLKAAESLRPRCRDLLHCLAAPVADWSDFCDDLVFFFEKQDTLARQPLSPPQNAVLAALLWAVHEYRERGYMGINNLTGLANNLLQNAGLRLRLSPRKVGSALTSLGFLDKERTSKGWRVWLNPADARRIHELVATYGLDNPGQLLGVERDCKLCRELRLVPDGPKR